MKLSNLIEELQDIAEEYGDDIEVWKMLDVTDEICKLTVVEVVEGFIQSGPRVILQ